MKTFRSDLLSDISAQKFDLILANLPYIPSSRIAKLDPSVRDYEPHLALDGGEDGLKFIRKLSDQAPYYLNLNGTLLLEVDDTHDEKVAEDFSGNWDIEIRSDQNHKIRYWICKSIA